jgi:hypothetical protein
MITITARPRSVVLRIMGVLVVVARRGDPALVLGVEVVVEAVLYKKEEVADVVRSLEPRQQRMTVAR